MGGFFMPSKRAMLRKHLSKKPVYAGGILASQAAQRAENDDTMLWRVTFRFRETSHSTAAIPQ
jgi:hypothetical protein